MPRVSLWIRVETPTGRRYLKAHPKKQRCALDGTPYPEAIYALRCQDRWKTVGKELGLALHHREQWQAEWTLGLVKPPATAKASSEGSLLLSNAIQKYLANITALKSAKTAAGYGFTLGKFQKSCTKRYLKDVRKSDLVSFVVYMKGQELSDRTISNRLVEIVTFLRHYDIKDVTVRHKYTEKVVKAYHPDDLKLLFCACQPEEWLLFQFFLCTGARDQEVMHACWGDIDFKDGIFTIRDHPEWGFRTKDQEEREIPLPSHLIEKLKARIRTSDLIFPTPALRPNGHFLRVLKELAERAGVNPVQCGLHKFRKTYATLQYENGVSARTIQKRLGHSSLETTLAYLEAADVRSDATREAVDSTFEAYA